MEQTWVLDPPARMFYDSKYAKILNQQDNRFNGELKILLFAENKMLVYILQKVKIIHKKKTFSISIGSI